MDRFDAYHVFAAVADHGSFAEAARRLGRSPPAVTRTVAALEERLATRLFNRTTRSVALTDEGVRYLDLCRRVLSEVAEIEASAGGERQEPRGTLAVTAPVIFGRLHVLPIVQTFLEEHSALDARLLLVDRPVSLIDEGLDVGVRLGRLPDSSLRAIHVGDVRRSVYASPDYLKKHGTPQVPDDLKARTCIAFTGVTPTPERWSFRQDGASITVSVKPRLVVNTGEAAIDAAVGGLGLICALSYQVTHHLEAGRLKTVLAVFEPPAVPIHILHPAGRHLPPKVRLFIDRAASALRSRFGARASDAGRRAPASAQNRPSAGRARSSKRGSGRS
jgi:DNA-binding transcriptional LysR family regulator